MKKIIMYTKNNCPNCNRAKFMIEVAPCEVELEIRNIDEDEKHNDFLLHVIRSKSLPTFMLVDTHGSYEENGVMYEAYIGFEENLGRIQEYLGI